jgi:hypothetical protein
MISARECSARLAALLRNERVAAAEFLEALADFDRRRLWADLGHAGLFSYLHRDLGLSLGAAQYKKTTVELIQSFPEVLDALRDGRLCQTVVCELAKVLTPGNRAVILPQFFGRSRREAAALAAEIAPRQDAPRRTVVTATKAVPPPPAATTSPPVDAARFALQPAEVHGEPRTATRAERIPPPRDEVVPLDADRRRMHVTVSRRLIEKLEAARDALSHPGASFEEIVEVGLDLVLDRHARRRGVVEKPAAARRSTQTDAIPAHVKRAVWLRDRGRCQAPLASGGICGSTYQVELHHRDAKARGGPATVDNLECRCKPHNLEAARRDFGDEWMDRFTPARARR